MNYIYIIKCNNFYKIGWAINVEERLKRLQHANPYTLQIIDSFKTYNHYDVEMRVHEVLKDYRVQGEWFQFDTSELVELTKEVIKATIREYGMIHSPKRFGPPHGKYGYMFWDEDEGKTKYLYFDR